MANLKRITWLGTSREDVKAFPDKIRKIVGSKLMTVQLGNNPTDSKPMSSIGQGVTEIRIQYEGQYRVIYIAKFSEAIYVLHAFRKKTQRTSIQDMALAKNRLKQIKR